MSSDNTVPPYSTTTAAHATATRPQQHQRQAQYEMSNSTNINHNDETMSQADTDVHSIVSSTCNTHHYGDHGSVYYAESNVTAADSVSTAAFAFPLQKLLVQNNNQNNGQDGIMDMPRGWTTAHDAQGRIYYWNVQSGATSWVHPKFISGLTGEQKQYSAVNGGNKSTTCTGTQQSNSAEIGGGAQKLKLTEQTLQESNTRININDNNANPMYRTPTKSTHHHQINNTPSPSKQKSPLLETPGSASFRPDSHQCCAVFALIVMPPLGCCSLFHSVMVDRAWSQGRFGDAVNHSRQSYNYAWFGVVVAIVLGVYFLIGGEAPDWMPDFDFND